MLLVDNTCYCIIHEFIRNPYISIGSPHVHSLHDSTDSAEGFPNVRRYSADLAVAQLCVAVFAASTAAAAARVIAAATRTRTAARGASVPRRSCRSECEEECKEKTDQNFARKHCEITGRCLSFSFIQFRK